MKTITINGVRYRLTNRLTSITAFVAVKGNIRLDDLSDAEFRTLLREMRRQRLSVLRMQLKRK